MRGMLASVARRSAAAVGPASCRSLGRVRLPGGTAAPLVNHLSIVAAAQEPRPAAGVGVRGGPYSGKDIPIGGTSHQAGTLRFGPDPATAVLDLACEAHGLDNLYVTDASFFPSVGAVNSTLTIIANALRGADPSRPASKDRRSRPWERCAIARRRWPPPPRRARCPHTVATHHVGARAVRPGTPHHSPKRRMPARISRLPAGRDPARLVAGGSPKSAGVIEPAPECGA
jgi:hypothetical protein